MLFYLVPRLDLLLWLVVVVGYLQTPVPDIMFTLPAARMVLPWWTL